MFARLGKHHYRDACMVFLSRINYWQETKHPMLVEFYKMLPEFSEVACELFFSVLSAHTKPQDSEDQIRQSAITVDLMKDDVATIHEVYKVKPLDCYTSNITPSTGPKFFSLVEETTAFLKSLFKKCVDADEASMEDATTFDKTTGLLSYKTKVFGLVPANLFPLPCSLPFCVVVCSICHKLLETSAKASKIRLKCGHMFHQMCLVPNLASIRMKALYKDELKCLCRKFNISDCGKKEALFLRLNISLSKSQKERKLEVCPGCDREDHSPSIKNYCHYCKRFIEEGQDSVRLPCSHLLHAACQTPGSCKICCSLMEQIVSEVCQKAKATFTKPFTQKDDDNDASDEELDAPQTEKEENLSHYLGELAVKAKHNKEQRGSLPKLKIDKVEID